MKVSIELEEEQITAIVLKELEQSKKWLTQDLKDSVGVFSMDPDQDRKEIQRHLDAFKLLLKYYGNN
jgi:hypothetical protein